MNKSEKTIPSEKEQKEYAEPLTPVAYSRDKYTNETRIVVQIGSKNEYAILMPPNFELDEDVSRGDWVLDAAIEKYFFVPFDSSQSPITNSTQMKKFSEKLLKQKEE